MAYKCDRCFKPLKVIEIEINTIRPSIRRVVKTEVRTSVSCTKCGELSVRNAIAS